MKVSQNFVSHSTILGQTPGPSVYSIQAVKPKVCTNVFSCRTDIIDAEILLLLCPRLEIAAHT